jgi:hypothetical protein
MGVYTGVELNKAICELLNIDYTNVYRVELICQVNDVAKITVYSYAVTDEGRLSEFADIIKHYEIKEIDSATHCAK